LLEYEPTFLQEKLENMTIEIGKVGIACAVLTFLAIILRIILEFSNIIPCGC
jgi:hypothetical protein